MKKEIIQIRKIIWIFQIDLFNLYVGQNNFKVCQNNQEISYLMVKDQLFYK
jgi:hypothetical protein